MGKQLLTLICSAPQGMQQDLLQEEEKDKYSP